MSRDPLHDTVTKAIRVHLDHEKSSGATFDDLTTYAWSHHSDYIEVPSSSEDLDFRVAKELLCLHRDGSILLGFNPEHNQARWFSTKNQPLTTEEPPPFPIWIPIVSYDPEHQEAIDWYQTLIRLFQLHPDGFTNSQILTIYFAHLFYSQGTRPKNLEHIRGTQANLSRHYHFKKTGDRWQYAPPPDQPAPAPKPVLPGFTLRLRLPMEYTGLHSVTLTHSIQLWSTTFAHRPGYHLFISSLEEHSPNANLALPLYPNFTGQIELTFQDGTTEVVTLATPTTLHLHFYPDA